MSKMTDSELTTLTVIFIVGMIVGFLSLWVIASNIAFVQAKVAEQQNQVSCIQSGKYWKPSVFKLHNGYKNYDDDIIVWTCEDK